MVSGQQESLTLDASMSVYTDPELLRDLAKIYESDPSDYNNIFQYASALAKSADGDDKIRSIGFFEMMLQRNQFLRESMYNLALVLYSLGRYDKARLYCEELYREEPDNTQVRNMHLAITYKHKQQQQQSQEKQETALGVALGIGLTAAAVGVGLLLSSRKKK